MSRLTTAPSAVPQGLYEESSVQLCDLGAKVEGTNGEVYRYVKAGGTALVAGKLQQAPAVVANHQNVTVASAAAANATEVTVTLGATAATANQYAGGVMVVNDVAGEGQTRKIKSHPAADSAATLTLTLEDGLETALTTSSQVCLRPNKYNGVIVHPTTPTGAAVGVAIKNITANYYGWIQTKGLVSCLNDSGTAVGLGVAPSQAVAGAVKTMAATLAQVGHAEQAGVDTEYRCIDLNLD